MGKCAFKVKNFLIKVASPHYAEISMWKSLD